MAAFAPRATTLLVALALSAASLAADAKTLRWAGRGDPQTMDPYSQNENLTNNINSFIYDTLVMRDRDLKVIPGLATSWEQVNPTTWRFKLRPGVKFHDGTPFTADDVVFSFERATADTSQIRAYATASGKPTKIDDLTVEFVTNGPNPIELEHLVTIFIMSKSWCEKNKCMKPLDFKNKEEMITARQANGTGSFILKAREPDVRTVMTRNPDWWGWKDKKFDGNVTEIIYTPITNDATRLSALIAGNVDLINDPAPQDVPKLSQTPGVKVIEGFEQRSVVLRVGSEPSPEPGHLQLAQRGTELQGHGQDAVHAGGRDLLLEALELHGAAREHPPVPAGNEVALVREQDPRERREP